MKTKLVIALGFSLTLTACSNGGSGGGDTKTGGLTNQGTSEQHKENYDLTLNGCNTGKHDFSSTSADEVKKQLCDALQDDQLNNSCAEPLRQDFFNKKCSGFVWTPKYLPASSDSNIPNQSPSPSSHIDYAEEENIRKALSFLLVDKYEISQSLAKEDKDVAIQFAEDMKSCGLNYLGPKCLDYLTYAGNYGGALSQDDKKIIFYSEFEIKGAGTAIAFKFIVDDLKPFVKLNKLEVLQIKKPRNGQNVSNYLKDSSNFVALMSVALVNESEQEAWNRLQSPRNIRELFHLSQDLLKMTVFSDDYLQVKSKIGALVQKNKNVLIESKDIKYQEEMFSLITGPIQLKNQDLVDICNNLLSSPSESIHQIAATIVLDSDLSRTDLKPTVLAALENSRYDIRKRAISALAKTRKTPEEENRLLAKIDDQDEDVRKEAIAVAERITMTNANLETIKKLGQSTNWSTRLQAAKLLGRINSKAAVTELILKMDDEDEDVRHVVMTELSKRSLVKENVGDLKKNFLSQKWEVRKNVAILLGKIKSRESLKELQNQLLKETDQDVKNQILISIEAVK
ncbi:MAG: HEAT repeat domain-containing protein [Pseudobdellovibrionaceae bacterium]